LSQLAQESGEKVRVINLLAGTTKPISKETEERNAAGRKKTNKVEWLHKWITSTSIKSYWAQKHGIG
jgi:hypothetical protein